MLFVFRIHSQISKTDHLRGTLIGVVMGGLEGIEAANNLKGNDRCMRQPKLIILD